MALYPHTVQAPVTNFSIRNDLSSTLEFLQEMVLRQLWEYSPIPAVFPIAQQGCIHETPILRKENSDSCLCVVCVYGAGAREGTSYWLHSAPRRHPEGSDWEERLLDLNPSSEILLDFCLFSCLWFSWTGYESTAEGGEVSSMEG